MSIPRDPYLGEPGYPEPWTTKQPREGLRDLDEAKIVSLSPDVCWTPCGSSVVAVPYPIVDFCGHDEGYTSSVRFTGKKAMVMRSRTAHVHNDKPGTKKGVKSGTVGDVCEPVGHADQVRAEGSHVIRHLDRFKMNKGNTDGEALFVRDTSTYAPPVNDDPVPGSLRAVEVADASDPKKTATDAGGSGGATLGFLAPAAARAITAAGGSGVATGGGAAAATGGSTAGGAAAAGAGVGLGTVLAGIGVFAVGMLFPTNKSNFSDFVPQDEFERQKISDAQKRITNLPFWDSGSSVRDDTIAELLRRRQTVPKPQVAPLPQSETVRIAERDEYRKKCQVDRYAKMKNICGQYSMQAHHIVPDWTLRYDRRRASDARIPNMPSLDDGMSICVLGNASTDGTEHNQGHAADDTIQTVGERSNPKYTATLNQVKVISIAAMIKVRPDCAKQIVEAVNKQFAGNNPNQLLRAKRLPPLPNETVKALKSGAIRSLP
ncbi:DUF4150 domain-containing protein [Allorhizobium taibaishanense]|uniref:Uncharacterized protein n=1 Tax=Allorhizobium taibaishanense TaxID=887144 RepID=A0A1Q9A099_9HYPH|nr:DUF4150 domain-containing protein [Allorhizobium taibaishanense]MBB4010565.1 hypothetical protein [Allorhizobium taibaishanense]OLP47901.1 hypothetical protein BJF91_10800 [Allorhizobium taibaishanense]